MHLLRLRAAAAERAGNQQNLHGMHALAILTLLTLAMRTKFVGPGAGHRAFAPVSPVRILKTWSSVVTQIFPSPRWPVRAPSMIALTTD